MPTPNDVTVPEDIRNTMEVLARQGKHFNSTQVWILVRCYEKTYNIQELADRQGMSYTAMYQNVKELEKFSMLEVAFKVGRTSFYKARFDLTEIVQEIDFNWRYNIRGQKLTFEQLLFYYYQGDLEGFEAAIFGALSYLYWKSETKAAGKKYIGPTGAEIKSMLLNICNQLESFITNVRVLTDGKLLEQSDSCHEYYGPVAEPYMRDILDRASQTFLSWWDNKQVSTKGLKLSEPRELVEQGKRKYNNRWRVVPSDLDNLETE